MSIPGIPAQRGGEPLRCPTCGSRLIEVERADILIDACPDCRGVWLDRGELDKILVRERQLAGGGDADDDFFREVEGRRGAPAQTASGSAAPAGRKPSEREAAELLARKAFDAYKGAKGSKSKKRKKGMLEQLLDF